MAKKNQQIFGEYIRGKREGLGKSLRGLAAEIEITPIYLSDIERGNRSAPAKYMESFIEVLKITDEQEIHSFYDMAGKSRNNIFSDLNEYIGNTDMARFALRVARDNKVTNEEWQKIINMIKKNRP